MPGRRRWNERHVLSFGRVRRSYVKRGGYTLVMGEELPRVPGRNAVVQPNRAAVECAVCGVSLGKRVRKGRTVCRVCAAKSAYSYLETALATPRRRRPGKA